MLNYCTHFSVSGTAVSRGLVLTFKFSSSYVATKVLEDWHKIGGPVPLTHS